MSMIFSITHLILFFGQTKDEWLYRSVFNICYLQRTEERTKQVVIIVGLFRINQRELQYPGCARRSFMICSFACLSVIVFSCKNDGPWDSIYLCGRVSKLRCKILTGIAAPICLEKDISVLQVMYENVERLLIQSINNLFGDFENWVCDDDVLYYDIDDEVLHEAWISKQLGGFKKKT